MNQTSNCSYIPLESGAFILERYTNKLSVIITSIFIELAINIQVVYFLYEVYGVLYSSFNLFARTLLYGLKTKYFIKDIVIKDSIMNIFEYAV